MNRRFFPFLLLLVAVIIGGSWYRRQRSLIANQPSASVQESAIQSTSTSPGVTASSAAQELEVFIKDMAQEVERAGGFVATSSVATVDSAALPKICEGALADDFDCYDAHYSKIVRTKGVKEAFADLRARYGQDPYVLSQCHPLAHVIGRIAAGKYKDVAEAYTHGDSFCWSGYYHGVLEGVIGKLGKKQLGDTLNTICAALPGKATYSFDYFNCVHGLGHGLTAYSQNELFDALALCDRLDGSWEQSSCYSGVFMENVIVDNKNHFTKYLKPSDPLYPCNAVGDKYKTPCYLMQTSYMLKITNGDFKKVFEYCANAEEAHRATCYQSLGRDASGRSASDVEITKTTCYLGEGFEQRSNCVIGAVKDFISYFHSDVQAKQFCESLDPELRETCSRTGEEYVRTL